MPLTCVNDSNYLQSPFFFLVSSLQAADDYDLESNRIDCNRTTAGTVVQSLHKLKDVDGSGTDAHFWPMRNFSAIVCSHVYIYIAFCALQTLGSLSFLTSRCEWKASFDCGSRYLKLMGKIHIEYWGKKRNPKVWV